MRIQYEQGYGDLLQVLRYVPLLQQRGVACAIEAPEPLRLLVRRSFPLADVREVGSPARADEICVPMMSLPLLMRTFSEEEIPRAVPYLIPDPAQVETWRERTSAHPGQRRAPRIGVIWRGNPKHPKDRWRSASIHDVAPLLDASPGIHLLSLQKDLLAHERALLLGRRNVSILDKELDSFDVTAAVMVTLDGVVSVDSAPAHLAGALGRPVSILLARSADWRWQEGRTDSPWYPTATLFRQRRLGDWSEPVAALVAALGEPHRLPIVNEG